MPGFDPDDIDVSVERGMLTIRGEMEDEDERQDRNYLVREYRRGTFVRSVRLPDTVDTDKVESTFENGVLKLVFPKAEEARPRKISVAGHDGNRQRRRSNGHAGNGSTQASGQSQSDGSKMTEAQHADARAGRQSQDSGGAGTGSQSGQPASAGSPTSSR